MPSLSHRISLIGGALLLTVALLGGVTALTLTRLGDTSLRLEQLLAQHRLLNEFQIAVNSTVILASGYARSGQQGALQDARDALDEARRLLPRMAEAAAAADLDGFAVDRQAQRVALVEEAGGHIERLTAARAAADAATEARALQRLDLIAQDAATLARIDTRLLDRETAALDADRHHQSTQGLASSLGTFALMTAAVLAAIVASHRQVAQPLRELEVVVQAVGAGRLDRRVAVNRRFEIGLLQAGVNAMASSLQQQQRELAEHTAALQRLTDEQGRLLETVNALGAPILPVRGDVLVLPIVGHIDPARAAQIEARLLDAVHRRRTRVAVIDLTGLANTDSDALGRFADLAHAITLLGAQVLFAGISPALAQVLVERGAPLDSFRSFRTVGDVLESLPAQEVARGR